MNAAAKQLRIKATELPTEDPNQLAVTLRIGELAALMREQMAMALDAHQVAEWVDQEGIAQHIKVSVQTVLTMCKKDGMPHSWAGQHRRFSRRVVDEWMMARGNVPPTKDQ